MKIVIILQIRELYFFFSNYDHEVVRVFQICEHQAKIVKLGRYGIMHLAVKFLMYDLYL